MSIVVECRNKTSENVIQNGDWTTSLNENILISEGDSIIVKDSFIDTQQSSSSKILIEDDTILYMDVGYYLINNDQSHFYDYLSTNPVPAGTRTLKPIVLCALTQGLSEEDGLITSYILETLDKSSKSVTGNILFSWDNVADSQPDSVSVLIPELGPTDFYTVSEVVGNVIKRSTGVTATLTQFNLQVKTLTYQSVKDKAIHIPFIQTISIPLEKGNYDPDELTEIMNREVNSNVFQKNNYLTVPNAILQTAQQIKDINAITSYSMCDPTDPSFIYAIAPMTDVSKPDIYIGSSIFEISYAQATKDFTINRLHTPYYDGGITIQYIAEGTAPTITYTTVNKIGGNFINRLYAKNSQDELIDFWSLQLGFGSDIITDFTYTENTGSTYPDQLVPISKNLVDGVGITGQSSTLDGVVSKSAPLLVPTIASSTVPADLTIGLKGTDNNPTNQQDKFGYYLVEVGSQFKNEFLTPENNYRSIQQIVNRYYELNSYTSAQNGQIIYEHKGEDMLLQSFRCRILTSDKKVPTNIGDDNTLHIEIVKGSKQK